MTAALIQVLLVEDNPGDARLIQRMLTQIRGVDFVVQHAERLTTGLTYLAAGNVDLVLLDLGLPDSQGLETFTKVRDQAPALPIIVMSGLDDEELAVEGVHRGAEDYLVKGQVDAHWLGRAIRYAVGRKRAKAELQLAYQNLKSLNDRLQSELDVARQVQRSLLPPPRPDWPDLAVFCYSFPTKDVGGNFYTYRAIDERRFAVAIGNISGNGMPAALLMAVFLALFQSVVGQGLAPSTLLVYLGNVIAPYLETNEQNCTLLYLEITPPLLLPRGGKAKGLVRAANAGYVPPLIKHIDGSVEWLKVTGPTLGASLVGELGYAEVTLKISSGDLIILTSDGVRKAVNAAGQFFGLHRLKQTVHDGPTKDAEKMLEHLKKELAKFVGEVAFSDDVTILVLQESRQKTPFKRAE